MYLQYNAAMSREVRYAAVDANVSENDRMQYKLSRSQIA